MGISRQAIHSQLALLQENNIIESIESSEIRGDKYRIKSNISVNIDITPDYYNIKYSTSTSDKELETFEFKDMNCSINYSKIKTPNEKIQFLGDEIRKIERDMMNLENQRKEFLNQKECLILEIKNLMHGQFKEDLEAMLKEKYEDIKDKNIRASLNLTEEILTTMFFKPERYITKFRIDELMDDLFFSDMDKYERNRRFGSLYRPLLEDLSRLMGSLLQEDEDDWFFDF